MSVLTTYFNSAVNQCSPVRDDYKLVKKYDEEGNEFIVFEKIDYPAMQESFGLVTNWSLDSLLKAGIDPAFPIHTGYATRLDGIADIESIAAEVEAAFPENNEPKNDE